MRNIVLHVCKGQILFCWKLQMLLVLIEKFSVVIYASVLYQYSVIIYYA
jgi:hypothetical protein